MSNPELDPEIRKRARFCKRILQHVEEAEDGTFDEPSSSPPRHHQSVTGTLSDPDKLFGNVTKQEMEKILAAYERQQNAPDKRDKPLQCDTIRGSSFEKLLFSKEGFHHQNSTSFLIENLGLKDASRASFLGGLSSYKVKDADTIGQCRRDQVEMGIQKSIKDYNNCVYAKADTEKAKSILDELMKTHPDHPDVLLLRGKCLFHSHNYEESVRTLKHSLRLKQNEETTNLLADAIYGVGTRLYHQSKYNEALAQFNEVLTYNGEHNGAQLHRGLCFDRINSVSRYGHQTRPAYRK